MTKEEFVGLIIEVCRTDATEDEQKVAAQKLTAGAPLPAIIGLATFVQSWLDILEADCDSACDRDNLYDRLRANLILCIDSASVGEAGVV